MTKRNFIIIIVILALAFIGYKFFMGGSSTNTNSALTVEANAKQQIGSDILEKLKALQDIDLNRNADFFKSNAFTSLKEETGNKVDVQSISKPNPFAPLNTASSVLLNKTN